MLTLFVNVINVSKHCTHVILTSGCTIVFFFFFFSLIRGLGDQSSQNRSGGKIFLEAGIVSLIHYFHFSHICICFYKYTYIFHKYIYRIRILYI